MGYAAVLLKVDDNGALIVAGSVALCLISSGEKNVDGTVGLDTLEPVSGWWIFEVKL